MHVLPLCLLACLSAAVQIEPNVVIGFEEAAQQVFCDNYDERYMAAKSAMISRMRRASFIRPVSLLSFNDSTDRLSASLAAATAGWETMHLACLVDNVIIVQDTIYEELCAASTPTNFFTRLVLFESDVDTESRLLAQLWERDEFLVTARDILSDIFSQTVVRLASRAMPEVPHGMIAVQLACLRDSCVLQRKLSVGHFDFVSLFINVSPRKDAVEVVRNAALRHIDCCHGKNATAIVLQPSGRFTMLSQRPHRFSDLCSDSTIARIILVDAEITSKT